MASDDPWTPEADARIDADDLLERRRKVLRLRIRRHTESQIAALLKVHQSTVSRDLHWIRASWRGSFGRAPDIDPGEIVGEALAVYQEVELLALNDAAAMRPPAGQEVESHDLIEYAQARMSCLGTVLRARQAQVTLLQDLGVIDRAAGSATAGPALPNATQIRAVLESVRYAELVEPPPPPPAG